MHLNVFYTTLRKLVTSSAIILTLFCSNSAQATIVQFETSFGNFEVNLYDETTPETVANFLQYVQRGDYVNSIIHRSEPGFVVQGGGYVYTDSWPVTAIASDAAVVNEPEFSNVAGTIAMAKLGGVVNSATNQWFFNLANNSANLDVQNGGFTVFGQVTGDGMSIIQQIADLQRYNLGGALGALPLQAFDGSSDPDNTNLVIINSVQVVDAAIDTAANLNPPKNTSVNQPSGGDNSGGGSSGGGVLSWSLLALCLIMVGRRNR